MQVRTASFVLLAFIAAVQTARTEGDTTAVLERALNAVQLDQIKQDLTYIASDELGGRNTPSRGLDMCADYIQSRLQELGFEPGYKDGYLHPYELSHTAIMEKGTEASFSKGGRKTKLDYGSDYSFNASWLTSLKAVGDIVFAGSGSEAELEQANMKNRWVLVRDNGDSPSKLVQVAGRADAVGVVFIPGAVDPQEYERLIKARRDRAESGSVSWPGGRRRGPRNGKVFPLTYLSSTGYGKLLATAGLSEQELKVGKVLGVRFTESRNTGSGDSKVTVNNVCGFWPGSDKRLKKDVIIVSAHYDHIGIGRDGQINNGADDNGSGTTGVLALAHALQEYGPMRRSVLLIWVSGEEKGLYGSKAWAEKPWLPSGCRPIANINLDMIGRNEDHKLNLTPTKGGRYKQQYNGIVRLAEKFAASEGFTELGSADQYYTRSDHANFAKLKIPVAFLFADIHNDYHRPSDTAEKINLGKIQRVIRLVMRMLDGMQEDKLDL